MLSEAKHPYAKQSVRIGIPRFARNDVINQKSGVRPKSQ